MTSNLKVLALSADLLSSIFSWICIKHTVGFYQILITWVMKLKILLCCWSWLNLRVFLLVCESKKFVIVIWQLLFKETTKMACGSWNQNNSNMGLNRLIHWDHTNDKVKFSLPISSKFSVFSSSQAHQLFKCSTNHIACWRPCYIRISWRYEKPMHWKGRKKNYHKVVSSNTSSLEPHPHRLFT